MPQAKPTTPTLTGALARAIASLSLSDLPDPVRELGRQLVLDTVGCVLGARTVEGGSRFAAGNNAFGSDGLVGLWGSTGRTGSAGAAFIHGNLANATESDETFRNLTHICAAVVPAVLAVAEETGIDGGEVLTATIAGYEVAARLALAMPILAIRDNAAGEVCTEWSAVGGQSWLALGACAGAVRAMGLDERAVEHALGIAAFCAPMPTLGRWSRTFPMPLTKYLMYGSMAQAGVIAARLAADGITGDPAILDGHPGLWQLTGACSFKPDIVMELFKQKWWIEQVSIKPYPCSRLVHPVLDGVRDLMEQAGVSGFGIEAIEIGLQKAALAPHYQNRAPVDSATAGHSFPYAVALTALNVPPGPEWMQASTLARSDVRTMMDRVHCREEPRATRLVVQQIRDSSVAGYEHSLSTVLLRTAGKTLTTEVMHANGDQWREDTRLSPDEVENKFRTYANGVLSAEAIEDFILDCRRLEQLSEVRAMLRKLGLSSRAPSPPVRQMKVAQADDGLSS